MKKNNTVEKQPTIKTKHKVDNSIEVTVTKAPNKTLTGKILVWVIAGLTMLLPLAGLIYMMIEVAK